MFEVKGDNDGSVMVSGALTIENIDNLHIELKSIFEGGNCNVLDCTGVTEISTPALQVLAAFMKSLTDLNRAVELKASPAVQRAMHLLGLTCLIEAA